MNNIWQLNDARSKFSEMIDCVLANGVQIITRRGKKTVVILSYEEYERLVRPSDTLSNFLMNSPLSGSDLELDRDRNVPHTIPFEPEFDPRHP